MCCVVIYKDGFCKSDEKIYGDLLEIWQQDDWSFRILRLREGSPWYVAWSSLYRAKHVTRLELVEGKSSK